jgi:hypothetical protein
MLWGGAAPGGRGGDCSPTLAYILLLLFAIVAFSAIFADILAIDPRSYATGAGRTGYLASAAAVAATCDYAARAGSTGYTANNCSIATNSPSAACTPLLVPAPGGNILVLKYSPMCKINLIHNTRTKCYWCQERRSYYVEEWNIVISRYILQVFRMSIFSILNKNIVEKKNCSISGAMYSKNTVKERYLIFLSLRHHIRMFITEKIRYGGKKM